MEELGACHEQMGPRFWNFWDAIHVRLRCSTRVLSYIDRLIVEFCTSESRSMYVTRNGFKWAHFYLWTTYPWPIPRNRPRNTLPKELIILPSILIFHPCLVLFGKPCYPRGGRPREKSSFFSANGVKVATRARAHQASRLWETKHAHPCFDCLRCNFFFHRNPFSMTSFYAMPQWEISDFVDQCLLTHRWSRLLITKLPPNRALLWCC